MGVRNLLRGSKDAALAFAARTFFNTKFRGVGEMTEFSIDTKTRSIHARLELVGEVEPIEIHVGKYELGQRGDQVTITVVDVATSRQWLTEVLRAFVIGKSFTIPPQAGTVLKLLA